MMFAKFKVAILGILFMVTGSGIKVNAQQILLVDDNDYITYNTDTLLNDLHHTTYSSIHHWNIADSAGATPTAVYMANFDLVIWYSSTDGVGLKFWTAGSAAGNPELVSYTAGGGKLWVIGQDLLYAKHATGSTFNSGDFAYDFMGLASYDVQSYVDDASTGCPQADRSPGAPVLFPTTLKWIFSTLWYVDGCTPLSATSEMYRMGPSSYSLGGRKCMFHNTNAGVNVMSTFFDPALIDTFVNRVDFLQQGLTYILGTAGLVQPTSSSVAQLYPNPSSGAAFLQLTLTNQTIVQVSITDVLGKICSQSEIPVVSGHHKLPLPVENVAPGLYIVQLKDQYGNYLYNGKFQKL